MAAQFGFSVPGGEEASITSSGVYPEIIQSRTLARALLKRNFNTEKFGEDQPLLKILTYSEEEPEFGPDTLEKMAVKALLKKINVSKSRQSSILTLEVSAFEPQFASDLANIVIEELDFYQREYNAQKTIKNTELETIAISKLYSITKPIIQRWKLPLKQTAPGLNNFQ